MKYRRFQGVVMTLLVLWTFIFIAGPAIDRKCVITKTGRAGFVMGKHGGQVFYDKGTRLVRKECSEFSRAFFARDVKAGKNLRKRLGAE